MTASQVGCVSVGPDWAKLCQRYMYTAAVTNSSEIRFAVAAEVVVLTLHDHRLHVLLTRVTLPGFTGRFSLPGGFVQPEESLEEAAYRELREEAHVAPEDVRLEQLRAYGQLPDETRAERVVSVAWVALGADLPEPDVIFAERAEWVPVDEIAEWNLAFGHEAIVRDGVEWARERLESTTLATAFCTEPFTLPELRRVYEAVWGATIDPRNFQRKVLHAEGFVEPTGEVVHGRGRPAPLFLRGGATRLHPSILRPEPHHQAVDGTGTADSVPQITL